MARQYTEQDTKQLLAAESTLRAKGLIVDEKDGVAESTYNGERIIAFYEANPNLPVTVENTVYGCEVMKDQLKWKSPAHLQAEEVFSKLKPGEAQIAINWLNRQRLVTEGDAGFVNIAEIVGWLVNRRHEVTDAALQMSLGNVMATRGTLTWRAAPAQESQGRPRHTGNSSFMSKSDTNLTARDHEVLRKQAADKAAGREKAPTFEPNYQVEAERIQGKTHGQTESLRQMFIMDGSDINWKETYFRRRKLAGL